MEKGQNARIGQGKAVHAGAVSGGMNGDHWFSNCGADHATNKGRVTYIATSDAVTCKKCLKSTGGHAQKQEQEQEQERVPKQVLSNVVSLFHRKAPAAKAPAAKLQAMGAKALETKNRLQKERDTANARVLRKYRLKS